jgi:hypothetical protein
MVNEPVKKLGKKLRNSYVQMKRRHNLPETVGHSKGSFKRKVYSHECTYQKTREKADK